MTSDHKKKSKIDKTRTSQRGSFENKYNGRYDFVFSGEFKGLVNDEITCQNRCNWPTCTLKGCIVKSI